MKHWIKLLADRGLTPDGAGELVALVLVLAVVVALPRGMRKAARLPTVLLALHLLAGWELDRLPARPGGRPFVEGFSVFCLLASLGRSLFLLIVDGIVGQRLRRPFPTIFHQLLQTLIYVLVGLVTLRVMGAELGSLLTTSAVLTAVIGLSLQETLSNFAAGLTIQMQRPFQVGHWIQHDPDPSLAGQVLEINWRATKIVTSDNIELVVPNSVLAKAPIRNFSAPSTVTRRILPVSGPYDVPPHWMEAALLDAVRGSPGVLPDPAPETVVQAYEDSGVKYAVVYYVEDYGRRMQIDSMVRRRIWYTCRRAGISLPYPVRDVRMHPVSPPSQAHHPVRRTPAERAEMLAQVDFLGVLPGHSREKLAASSSVHLYASGEDVIRQGDAGSELFIVKSGEASVLFDQAGGGAVEVARLGPGHVFGEMSLMTGEPRSATVRAITDCELIVLGHAAFREVLAETPELLARISEVLAKRQGELADAAASLEASDGPPLSRSGLLLGRIRGFLKLS